MLILLDFQEHFFKRLWIKILKQPMQNIDPTWQDGKPSAPFLRILTTSSGTFTMDTYYFNQFKIIN
jgi:hypothetical protein